MAVFGGKTRVDEMTENKPRTAAEAEIAVALIKGGSSQAEVAEQFGTSLRTVERIASSDWFETLREELVTSTVAAAKSVFEAEAQAVAKRLVKLATAEWEEKIGLAEPARKAAVDVLQAAGVDMGADGNIPTIRIT